MRSYSGLGATQQPGHLLGRKALHIAQHQGGPLARAEQPQPVLQVVAMLGAQHAMLRALRLPFGRVLNLAKRRPGIAAQEIDGRIVSDARQPVGRLFLVFELILALQCLDEGLLRQVLGVGNVSHEPVDLPENPP